MRFLATIRLFALGFALAIIGSPIAEPAAAAAPSENYAPAPTFAGMSEEEFARAIQERMPLPVAHIFRKVKGDRFVYGIELDASSLPVNSDVLTASFELPVEASREELLAAIDKAVQQVRLETIRVFERNAGR